MKKGYDESDIIARYLILSVESPIPCEGNFQLFYDAFTDRDNTILLSDGNEFHVFYFTSYDIVEEVGDDAPVVIFEPFENVVKCVIIFNPEANQTAAIIALDMKEKEHRDFLQKICNTHSLQFHFISMLYGELYRMKSCVISIPEEVCANISDLKQL